MRYIIVNYCQCWGSSGTHYNQQVKINKETMEKFNNYLLKLKTEIDINFFKKRVYSDFDLKVKLLDYLQTGVNYTNLIHLDLFRSFYIKELYTPPKKDKDFERILDRNTIFIVE